MGARETFLDLAARGIRLVAQGDRLVVTPASLLTAEDRDAIRHYRDELLALLTEGPDSDHRRAGGTSATPVPAERAADPVVLSDWQAADRAYQRHAWRCPACSSAGRGYGSRCPTGAELWKAYTAQPGPATSKPERQPQPAEPPRHPFERERRNWTPATEPELRRMAAMFERARALGFSSEEADRAADVAQWRDRTGDDRRLCLECRSLRAGASSRWWCAAQRQPLPQQLVMQPHRCELFDDYSTKEVHNDGD
ncbi:hypothetical protein EDC36_1155 [Tepidimonas ignava]|uniref:TubC N-terminal docking domain-containing protein n=2 Tax=Tepidimonas ignava TaxID=114249 RepID=A0A4R3L7Y5_9BURK|nr:hypothetical protein EDC36_1155 [Tepidimonas ignava]TSE19803.1 hypothetical protein Tigna_02132 [Tepidimonas ignava]